MAPEPGTRVDEALAAAKAAGVARLDAVLLLGHVLGLGRSTVIAHAERELRPAEWVAVQGLIRRRAAGIPLSYLLGQREFHGLMLRITPDVLDPRPDTETLVDWALDMAETGARVIDLGTGSGAIALAVKAARPDCEVHATDASAAALSVAIGNAQALDLAVAFHGGFWWQAVAGQRFDLAVSNPPYIAPDDPHLTALVHEPAAALVAGQEGLADLRQIIAGAPAHLTSGGWLLLEHGHDQATAVAQCLQAHGFVDVAHRRDLAGHTRCTGGRLRR